MTSIAIDLTSHDGDQVFSYWRGKRMLHFNTSLLARIHDKVPGAFRKVTIDLNDAIYNLCMEHRGIEEPKVDRLKPSDLRTPGYAVIFPESDYTIVDGHHRLVRRYRAGLRMMDFHFTTDVIWQHCLVEYGSDAEAQIAEAVPPRVSNGEHIANFARMHEAGQKKT